MANITKTQQVRRLKESVSLSDIPLVVGIIAAVSGWLLFKYGGYSGDVSGSLLIFLDPTLYIVRLFLHESWSGYIGSMYFFVPAGIALTYMTNNRIALGVVAASHVFAVLLTGISYGLAFSGTMAAAYGLLAAAMVRATKIGTEKYSAKTQQGAPIGILFVAVFGLLMMVTTSDVGVQYTPVLVGFVFGGAFEAIRVYIETRRTGSKQEEDEDFVATTSRTEEGSFSGGDWFGDEDD